MAKRARKDKPFIPSRLNPNRNTCQARTKNGTPCKRMAMENGRCYSHGGKAGSTWLLPYFARLWFRDEMGRRTAFVEHNWRQAFHDALDKRDRLLEVGEDLATLEVVIEDRIGQLKTVHIGQEFLTECRSLMSTISGGGLAGAQALVRLESLLNEAERIVSKQNEAEKALLALIEQRRRILDTHSRQQQLSNTMIAKSEASEVILALVAAVNMVVSNPEEVQRIRREWERILAGSRNVGAQVLNGGSTPALEAEPTE